MKNFMRISLAVLCFASFIALSITESYAGQGGVALDMFGLNCRPVIRVAPAPVIVIPKTVIRSHGNYAGVYDIQGDRNASDQKIARHLMRDHGINPAGMSRSDMLRAHDRAHGVAVSAAPRQSVSSGCPGGVCPTGVRTRGRLR